MGNANTTPADKLEQFNNIDESLEKARAIVRLMAYAANEGSFDHREERIWAQQVVDSLIEKAMESVALLADKNPEGEA